MRKIIVITGYILLCAVAAYAVTFGVTDKTSKNETYSITKPYIFADNAAVNVSPIQNGFHLFQVRQVATADNTITVAIATGDGAPLYTHTTTSAADGSAEIEQPTAFWFLPEDDTPTITVSDMEEGGTATVYVTVIRE